MKWQEIRDHYPQQWLLVEAIKARSEANKRILEQLAVIGTYPDSVTALKRYQQLHHEAPDRELYVFHTSRETLDITDKVQKTYTKVSIKNQTSDFAYWQTQPYQARLAALEQIRQDYHRWRYDAEPRFQRVYHIVKR